jgi:hypothetical protein
MGNGEWGMGNGEWGMGNGEWGMGNGEWGMGNGEKILFLIPTPHSPLPTPHLRCYLKRHPLSLQDYVSH